MIETWENVLDTAWDTRRRVGGRAAYRDLLQRFAHAFVELTDPVSNGPIATWYCDDGTRRRFAVVGSRL